MKQLRIKTIDQALDASSQAIGGATAHAAAIGAKTNDAAAITEDRNNVITKRDAHEAAKVEVKNKRMALMALILTAITFVTLARDMLKVHLGRQYSTAWSATGFNGKLVIPRSLTALKALLEKLFAYFTANPTHQNTEANVTANRSKAIVEQIVAAENAWNAAQVAARQALAEKLAAFKTLVKRLSGTFRELNQFLAPTDVRYLSYGFSIPGILSTPEVPLNLLAVLIGPNAVALKWDRAERAQHYRVWKKVIGVDEEFVALDIRDDLDFVVEGLPAGKTVELAVSAVNNGGESARSEAVQIVTA